MIGQTIKDLDFYTRAIEEATNALIAARIKATETEAAYLDAKDVVYTNFGAGMSATALQQKITSLTIKEKKAYMFADCAAKNAQSTLNVYETANNNLKMKARLQDMEIKNLNLQ